MFDRFIRYYDVKQKCSGALYLYDLHACCYSSESFQAQKARGVSCMRKYIDIVYVKEMNV